MLHGLLTEHTLGDAGVLEEAFVVGNAVLPANPGCTGAEQD